MTNPTETTDMKYLFGSAMQNITCQTENKLNILLITLRPKLTRKCIRNKLEKVKLRMSKWILQNEAVPMTLENILFNSYLICREIWKFGDLKRKTTNFEKELSLFKLPTWVLLQYF